MPERRCLLSASAIHHEDGSLVKARHEIRAEGVGEMVVDKMHGLLRRPKCPAIVHRAASVPDPVDKLHQRALPALPG